MEQGSRLFLKLLALALPPFATIAGAAPARHPAPRPPAGPRDWTQVASRTARGGDLLGNPAAKVKLVEFLSFTCPHCAVFEADAVPKLIDRYVRTGRVSYEVRIALRDQFDLAAAVLARCDGPRRFFALAPVIFADQARWTQQGDSWTRTAPDLGKMSEADAMRALVKGAGLDRLLAEHGLPPARAAQCAGNVADQRLLSTGATAIWAMPGFPGTPAFLVNGTLKPDIHDWAGLDAALR